ncbi:MAG: recombinase family protein, partial [Clostridia bacterium]|nr:recombinase family protein [Clostridia bacterium]
REEKKRSFLAYLESVLSASSSGETFRFDERLWDRLVDNVCVYSHESFLVTFSDGTEIRV